ncbi:hypothetical protein F4815DRAFT_138871 [Daldinia loculata]|nr:hypothetical protein F4815DRAFT_138871 [Daldinia loculata]
MYSSFLPSPHWFWFWLWSLWSLLPLLSLWNLRLPLPLLLHFYTSTLLHFYTSTPHTSWKRIHQHRPASRFPLNSTHHHPINGRGVHSLMIPTSF